MDVSSIVNGEEYGDGLPEGEALKQIQTENPFYQKDGTLVFTEQEQIELLMGALRDRELADMMVCVSQNSCKVRSLCYIDLR